MKQNIWQKLSFYALSGPLMVMATAGCNSPMSSLDSSSAADLMKSGASAVSKLQSCYYTDDSSQDCSDRYGNSCRNNQCYDPRTRAYYTYGSCPEPKVNMVIPADGAAVGGLAQVVATAQYGNLDKVSMTLTSNPAYVFTIPGNQFQYPGDNTYQTLWDTSQGANGVYYVEAQASNWCTTKRQAHYVTIFNAPPPASAPAPQPQAPAPAAAPAHVNGPECWVPESVNGPNELRVYRFWKNGDRMITNSLDEGCGAQYTRESSFFFYQTPEAGTDMKAVYRCYAPGNHFFSMDAACEGFVTESVVGYLRQTQASGTVPIYRLWNKNNGDHLMSYLSNEAADAGFISEGVIGFGPQ